MNETIDSSSLTPFQANLEALLIDSISGDNDKMSEASQLFLKFKENNFDELIISFLAVLDASNDNINLRNASLANLAALFRSYWSEINENLRSKIFDFLIQFHTQITEQNIHLFAGLVFSVLNNIEEMHHADSGSVMFEFFKNDIVLQNHYFIELFCLFNSGDGETVAESILQKTFKVVLNSLRDTNFFYKSLGIRGVTVLLNMFPSQAEIMQDHIQEVFKIAKMTTFSQIQNENDNNNHIHIPNSNNDAAKKNNEKDGNDVKSNKNVERKFQKNDSDDEDDNIYSKIEKKHNLKKLAIQQNAKTAIIKEKINSISNIINNINNENNNNENNNNENENDKTNNNNNFFCADENDSKLGHIIVAENDFNILWRNIAEFLQLEPIELIPFESFIPIVIAAARRTDISPESRISPLLSFRKSFSYLDINISHEIADLSIEIGREYVRRVHQLPSMFLFFYDSLFNIFSHHHLYVFARKIILSLMQPETDHSSKVVALCMLHSIVQNVPHNVFNDLTLVTGYVEFALKQLDEVLFLEVGCLIVSSFLVFFTWNLVDPDFFIVLTVPLLVHPHPDVRENAYLAVHRLFEISLIPTKKSISMIISLADKVGDLEYWRYLKLLSVAISKQNYLEPEEYKIIETMIMPLFESKIEGCVCGALAVATQLMQICCPCLINSINNTNNNKSLNDNSNNSNNNNNCNNDSSLCEKSNNNCSCKSHECFYSENQEYFVRKVKELIIRYLNTSDEKFIYLGMSELLNWITITGDCSLVTDYSAKIMALLDIDITADTLVKSAALSKISVIDSMTSDHPFLAKLLSEVMPLIESDSPAFLFAAIRVLKRCTPFLSGESAIATFNAIATACVKTKVIKVACKCFSGMSKIIKVSCPEIKMAVLPSAIHMCDLYVKGELAVLNGVPPMSTDPDISLLFSSQLLFITLFVFPTNNISNNINNNLNDNIDIVSENGNNSINGLLLDQTNAQHLDENRRLVFNELLRIFQKGNNLQNEMILYVFSRAVSFKVLNESELSTILGIALSISSHNLPVVLMRSTSNLLIGLISLNCISWDMMRELFPFINEWWNRCKSEKHILKKTLSSIALLLWQTASHFKTAEFPLIEQSFEQFPPSDITRIVQMAEILISFFDEHTIAFEEVSKTTNITNNTSANNINSSNNGENNSNNVQIYVIPVNICVAAAVSICKFLIRPKIELRKRGISEILMMRMEMLLDRIRRNNPDVQKAINEFIAMAPSRMEILSNHFC